MAQEVELAYIEPGLGRQTEIFKSEPLTVTVGIKTSYPVHLIRVQLWTNLKHKTNYDGEWHGIDLEFLKKEQGTAIFRSSYLSLHPGTFEYTVRYSTRNLSSTHQRSKSNANFSLTNSQEEAIEWKWADASGKNGIVRVAEPNEQSWTQGPQLTEVYPLLFIGNLCAASQAQEFGFDAVLNMECDIDIVLPQTIHYKKAARNINSNWGREEEEELKEIIGWLDQRAGQNAKTLIFCREGSNKCGPIAVAYNFYVHPEWTFAQTCENVGKLKENLPHANIQSCLEKNFPRISKSNGLLHTKRVGSLTSFNHAPNAATQVK
eukprot:TRINITY_DN4317_c0_g1_i1.p1 TRINITY_DN4317_c0_g1~~TRINITY_DN4317_c0_g1_i1.p1  ORF type:complete len:319 (-),score=104.73 TRINITY_DN4317_c0_g1_i1:77-1033(-)